jgi:hypothetical protein
VGYFKLLLIGVALAAAILIGALVLVSTSSDDDGTTSTPAASATERPSSTPGGEEAALDVPEAGGSVSLAAGSYRTARFQPEAHFALQDGWLAAFDTARFVQLFRGGDPNANCVCLISPDGIIGEIGGEVQPLPGGGTVDDMIDWLTANANLKTSNPSSLQVGNLSGRQLDIEVQSGVVPVDVVEYLSAGNERFSVTAVERQHLTVLDFRGSPLIIAQRSPAADYNEYFTLVERVVGSLTFSN